METLNSAEISGESALIALSLITSCVHTASEKAEGGLQNQWDSTEVVASC